MRKILLKEEFGASEYNRIAGLAKTSSNEKLRSLLPFLSKFDAAQKRLREIKNIEINKPLSEKIKKEKMQLIDSLPTLKEKIKEAEEIAKDVEKEVEAAEVSTRAKESAKKVSAEKVLEPKKVAQAREAKSKAAPELSFTRIRTAGKKLGEDYNWKDRVRFYLAAQ